MVKRFPRGKYIVVECKNPGHIEIQKSDEILKKDRNLVKIYHPEDRDLILDSYDGKGIVSTGKALGKQSGDYRRIKKFLREASFEI